MMTRRVLTIAFLIVVLLPLGVAPPSGDIISEDSSPVGTNDLYNDATGATTTTAESVTSGRSLILDGVDDRGAIADAATTDVDDTGSTYSIWVRFLSIPGGSNLYSLIDDGSGVDDVSAAGFNLVYDDGSNGFTGCVASNANHVFCSDIGAFAIVANTWYHVVFRISATQIADLYVNGAQQGADVNWGGIDPLVTGSDDLALGREGAYLRAVALGSADDGLFNGYLDDFRYYQRALSDVEISALYNGGAGGEPADTTEQTIELLMDAPNAAPTASFTVFCAFRVCNVDGGASTDSDGSISTYSWDWGDASTDTTGVTSEHEYDTAGYYTITLTVTDNGGATDTATRTATPYGFVGEGGVLYGGNRTDLADSLGISVGALDFMISLILIFLAMWAGHRLAGTPGAGVGAFAGSVITIALGLIPIWFVVFVAVIAAAFFGALTHFRRGGRKEENE